MLSMCLSSRSWWQDLSCVPAISFRKSVRPLVRPSEMFGQGIFFIVSGLFKKAVISDYISVNFMSVFSNPDCIPDWKPVWDLRICLADIL